MSNRRVSTSRASQADQLRQHRRAQLEQIVRIIDDLDMQINDLRTRQQDQLNLLSSVSLGLYEEIEKLQKKLLQISLLTSW